MRDRKGVALDRRRCEEELEGVEEGETLPRIYYVKKNILKKIIQNIFINCWKNIGYISNVPLSLDSYNILSYKFKLCKYCKQQKRRLEPGRRDKRKK